MLNEQRFPLLGLYLKFGLYRILIYSGIGLDRFQCTIKFEPYIFGFIKPYHLMNIIKKKTISYFFYIAR